MACANCFHRVAIAAEPKACCRRPRTFRQFFLAESLLLLPGSGAVSAQESRVYHFADCELDPREHRLLVHGQPVTLTPKVFETLVLLVERAGHVVSKDELMAALWPRGFVHESNLTKHIWLIRRALGEGEDEGRYIETVPKLGYRFVAPVQLVSTNEDATKTVSAKVEASAAETMQNGSIRSRPPDAHPQTAPDQIETTSASRSKRPRILIPTVIVMAIIVVAATGLQFWRSYRNPAPTTAPDAGAVAIVDFNNLSGNDKDAWLGPALEQMLATEVAANGKLHAVSEELVRPARADLPAPDAGGYAPASLAALQHRLGAHYVLSGAYLVSGNANTPQLRVDLTVQDAQSGTAFASVSRQAAINDLPRLVAQVGGDLRSRFGERTSGAAELKQLAAAQPPSSEVARHVGFALQALSQYDPARARDELLQAIAQAPGYAPAYVHLAGAWSALGYRAKAIAAAKQAVENAGGLSEEERLQIQAQQFGLQGDHAHTTAAYAKLVELRPQNPEYRLHLVAALVEAGKYDEADAALTALRKLPGMANDPRVEFAAADIATGRDDSASLIAHAGRALQLARSRGEAGLIATAELQLGRALGQDAQAEPLLRGASAGYRRVGNPHGEALAWQNLANLQDARNQIGAARESYQRAMAIYQGIGDLGGEAAIYDNLARMLWSAGDRDGTQTALRQALRIGRETNDPVRQAWSLTGLATALSDESAGDEVAAMYREAIALDRQSNARSHLAFALSYYADLLRVRGQLHEAGDACAQAQTVATSAPDASQRMSADFECAQVALDRGEPDFARKALASIEQSAIAAKDTFDAANAQLVLGQIAMGQRQWASARELLQKSLQGWVDQKEVPGEATTDALLGLCHAALGDEAGRDKAMERARDLRGQVTARQEVLGLDIALAELQADVGKPDEAISTLRALADDAIGRHWIGYAFEARLAAQRVLERSGNEAAAKSSRDALDADARAAGFLWVAQRLALTPSARLAANKH